MIGLPEEVTWWDSRSISEKAAARPYHWAEYCLRPSALVKGSSNLALSAQSDSFLTDGRPAKS